MINALKPEDMSYQRLKCGCVQAGPLSQFASDDKSWKIYAPFVFTEIIAKNETKTTTVPTMPPLPTFSWGEYDESAERQKV